MAGDGTQEGWARAAVAYRADREASGFRPAAPGTIPLDWHEGWSLERLWNLYQRATILIESADEVMDP